MNKVTEAYNTLGKISAMIEEMRLMIEDLEENENRTVEQEHELKVLKHLYKFAE